MGLIVAHEVGGALTAPNGSEKFSRAMLHSNCLRKLFSFAADLSDQRARVVHFVFALTTATRTSHGIFCRCFGNPYYIGDAFY